MGCRFGDQARTRGRERERERDRERERGRDARIRMSSMTRREREERSESESESERGVTGAELQQPYGWLSLPMQRFNQRSLVRHAPSTSTDTSVQGVGSASRATVFARRDPGPE